jgi:hypothetical protein
MTDKRGPLGLLNLLERRTIYRRICGQYLPVTVYILEGRVVLALSRGGSELKSVAGKTLDWLIGSGKS